MNDGGSLDVAFGIVYSSGVSPNVLSKLLDLYKAGSIGANVFGRLWLTAENDGIDQPMVEEFISCLIDAKTEEALPIALELADYYFLKKEPKRYCDKTVLFRVITNEGCFRRPGGSMTDFHWYCVTNDFRQRFPEKDLEIF